MRFSHEGNSALRPGLGLPLPVFVLQPFTAVVAVAVYFYKAYGQLARLFDGAVQWTYIWKDFGASGGDYGFAALAMRGIARRAGP